MEGTHFHEDVEFFVLSVTGWVGSGLGWEWALSGVGGEHVD